MCLNACSVRTLSKAHGVRFECTSSVKRSLERSLLICMWPATKRILWLDVGVEGAVGRLPNRLHRAWHHGGLLAVENRLTLVAVNLFTHSFQDACTERERERESAISSTFLTCAGDFIAVRVTALSKEFHFNVVVSVNARIANLVSRTHGKGMVGRLADCGSESRARRLLRFQMNGLFVRLPPTLGQMAFLGVVWYKLGHACVV